MTFSHNNQSLILEDGNAPGKMVDHAHENEKILVNKLDSNAKILWQLLSCKLGNIEANITSLNASLSDSNNSIKKLECRIESVEQHLSKKEENVFRETNERNERAKNFVIFGYNDSESASNTDLTAVKNFFSESNSANEVPFNIDSIKVKRMGKFFKSDSTRPLLVKLSEPDHVNWIFKNRKSLFPTKIIIGHDLTKMQREYFKEVKLELKNRSDLGEKNLVIKYHYNIPFILQKNNSKH